MSGQLDPNEYDLGELRDAAHDRPERTEDPRIDRRSSDVREAMDAGSEPVDAGRHESTQSAPESRPDGDELEFFSRLDRGDVERPYLPRVPDGYDAQMDVLEWLERLLETGDPEAVRAALSYYESVGWLSADSRGHIEAFLEGLDGVDSGGADRLGIEDHRTSFRYVARLSARLDE